jgi:hypothetical protein
LSVGSIGLSIQTPPGGKQASGVVSVRNNAGNPVSGATITASWSGLRSLSNLTATSDAQGFAAFKTSDPIATSGTFTLSVKDVAFPGARYDASKNAVSSASISVP